MVGKHAWKLVSTLGSLITWWLKAKYFLRGDYYGAVIGQNPSYVWHSIWSVKDVIWWGISNEARAWEQPYQFGIFLGFVMLVFCQPLINIWSGHILLFQICWSHTRSNWT